MALATRCPYCRTTFRVANDQLKLRAGLVRCGACKQVFNGIEHLLQPEAAPASSAQQPSPAAPVDAVAAAPDTPHPFPAATTPPASDASAVPNGFLHEDDAEQAGRPEQTVPAASQVSAAGRKPATSPGQPASGENHPDPLQRMTLMDFSAFGEDESVQAAGATPDKTPRLHAHDEAPPVARGLADTPDDLDKTIEELQRKPWRKPKKRRLFAKQIRHDDEDAPEPGFVAQANRRQRIGRAARLAMSAGSVVLILALLGQAAYAFRNQVAARWPETRPILGQACSFLGCVIGLPSQIDKLSIESSELQASASSQAMFTLVALLRNRSAIAQTWPQLELSLNDANDKPIARRVFAPREYLPPSQDAAKGFAPDSEQTVRLHFALSQLKASGYRVYLFYP